MRSLGVLAALILAALCGPVPAGARAFDPNDAAVQEQVERMAASLHAQWATAHKTQDTQAADVTEPSVVSGRILTPEIDVTKAPGVPALRVVIAGGTVGAAYFHVGVASPTGEHYYVSSGSVTLPPFGTPPSRQAIGLHLRYPFGASLAGLYTAPGVWRLYTLLLMSRDGTVVIYDARQLAALFPSLAIQVANGGTPDRTPPVVGSGEILTPVISMGGAAPYFAAHLGVADNLSGVSVVSIVANGPGGATFATQAWIGLPLRRGGVTSYAALPAGAPLGTWSINYLYACDVATNCIFRQKREDIQAIFGTTVFQVVQ